VETTPPRRSPAAAVGTMSDVAATDFNSKKQLGLGFNKTNQQLSIQQKSKKIFKLTTRVRLYSGPVS
jgi:hypothetical protein